MNTKKRLKVLLQDHTVRGVNLDKLVADVERLARTVSDVEAQPWEKRRTVDTDRRLERLRSALAGLDRETLKAMVDVIESPEPLINALSLVMFCVDMALRDSQPKRRGGVRRWYPLIYGAYGVFWKHFKTEPTTVEDGLFADFVRVCYYTKNPTWNEVELKRRITFIVKWCRNIRRAMERSRSRRAGRE